MADLDECRIEPAYSPLKTIEDIWDTGHASDAVPIFGYIIACVAGFVACQQALLGAFSLKHSSGWVNILSLVSGILICMLVARAVRLVKCQLYVPVVNRQIIENDQARAEQITTDARTYLASLVMEKTKLEPAIQALTDSIAKTAAAYQKSEFAVYWDTLEKSMWQLQTLNTTMSSLKNSLEGYRTCLEGYKHNFPVMPVQISDLPQTDQIYGELKKAAKLGRNNNKCIEALENRWISKALFAGYKTVPEALENSRSTLFDAVNALRREIKAMLM